MKRLSSISGTILVGVLSASGGRARAAQEPGTPVYVCSVQTPAKRLLNLDAEICADQTPLLVRPDNPEPICLLSRGQSLWLFGTSGGHVRAFVQSAPCSRRIGWVDRNAVGFAGRCAM